jgi:hypothetical protein
MQGFEKIAAFRKEEKRLIDGLALYIERYRKSGMAINLHLDGLRDRYYRDSIRVRNYNEFTLFVRHFGLPDFVLFEYDVDKEDAGYECAKFLIIDCLEKNVPLPLFKVYGISSNNQKDVELLLGTFQKRTRESKA